MAGRRRGSFRQLKIRVLKILFLMVPIRLRFRVMRVKPRGNLFVFLIALVWRSIGETFIDRKPLGSFLAGRWGKFITVSLTWVPVILLLVALGSGKFVGGCRRRFRRESKFSPGCRRTKRVILVLSWWQKLWWWGRRNWGRI